MSILDTLRAKLRGGQDDEYYDDEYYDEDGYDEVDGAPSRSYDDRAQQSSSNRLLGNPSRPEAESVSVYTRSGKPIGTNPAASYDPQQDMRSRASAHLVRSLLDILLLTSTPLAQIFQHQAILVFDLLVVQALLVSFLRMFFVQFLMTMFSQWFVAFALVSRLYLYSRTPTLRLLRESWTSVLVFLTVLMAQLKKLLTAFLLFFLMAFLYLSLTWISLLKRARLVDNWRF